MSQSQQASPFEAALRLSPHFEHLDSTKLPNGYKGEQSCAGHAYAVLDTPIEKSPNDDRGYRCILLLCSCWLDPWN